MYGSSPLRSTLNANVITGLGMCKVCTGTRGKGVVNGSPTYRYIVDISSVFFPPLSFWFHLRNRHVAATECSYAAILSDGGLVTWGSSHFGGDSREIQELELEFETLLLFHCFFSSHFAL